MVRIAVDAMVLDCLTRKEAALKAGLTDHALYCALVKPHVAAYRNTLMGVLRTSEASRTIARAVKLADTAESEHVKLQANTWIAGLESIAPVQRTENIHVHQHLIPGLTVVREGWRAHADDPRLIDGQAHHVEKPHAIKRIGTPVPHPEAGNALPAVVESVDPPGKRKASARRPRGAK